MKTSPFAGLLLLLCSAVAFAQAASPTSHVGWDINGQAVAVASAATYNGYVDALPVVALTGVSCVTSVSPAPSGSTCTANWPPMTAGAHTITITQVIAGAESSKSTPPLSFTFTIVVTPTNVRQVP